MSPTDARPIRKSGGRPHGRRQDQLRVRPATAADSTRFGAVLRRVDQDELHAATGLRDAPRLVALSIAASQQAFAVETAPTAATPEETCGQAMRPHRPAPVMIFGWTRPAPLTESASLWMLASDLFADHYREVCRKAKAFLLARAPRPVRFYNHIDARNQPALRFIRFLGATLAAPAPFGRWHLPFHAFELELPHV